LDAPEQYPSVILVPKEEESRNESPGPEALTLLYVTEGG